MPALSRAARLPLLGGRDLLDERPRAALALEYGLELLGRVAFSSNEIGPMTVSVETWKGCSVTLSRVPSEASRAARITWSAPTAYAVYTSGAPYCASTSR